MSPNCAACDERDHEHCTTRFEGDCECATRGHRDPTAVDQETSAGIPNYAILDLWMALGHEPNREFDDAIEVRGKADVWSYLLAEVRALNSMGRLESVSVAENGDPLYLRAKAALDAIHEVRSLTVDISPEMVVRDGYGTSVRRTLEATVTVVGPVS